MRVLLFAPRFRLPVVSGAKRQTIRGPRARPIRPGDDLSLRAWSGVAYRSPQELLREARCLAVEPIALEVGRRVRVELAGVRLDHDQVGAFVLADGFRGIGEFRLWWRARRGEGTFEGVLIRWG